MTRKHSIKRSFGWIAAVAVGGGILILHECAPRWPSHEGELRQTVRLGVHGVRRGAEGTVLLQPLAHYTPRDADDEQVTSVGGLDDVALALVDAKGAATPLAPGRWKRRSDDAPFEATLTLPAGVPDGDYTLRATLTTELGPAQVDLALPIYAPARVHVITDRPLYEPGNAIQFRAVALRARDLAPLDGRPGVWTVTNPSGEVVLEDKAPAGPWGVAAGSFPLDRSAETGTWHVAWTSAGATDDVAVRVEPFVLPRFHVDATADRAFYRAGDTPRLAGAVVYSSGAPVAGAELAITWTASGDWPPPTAWLESLLPHTAKAAANGRFELALPTVPADLIGTAHLTARIAAVDAAGDRVESAADVLLSQDAIAASAVTELGDGLIQSANNRVYLRVTTPDGAILPPGAKIHVRRAWEPHDPGLDAQLDEDGVASLNLDPGAPVNVVIPAVPYRAPPRREPVSRGEIVELASGQPASLADQEELDRWLPALQPCAKWPPLPTDDAIRSNQLALRVDASGAIVSAVADDSDLGRCLVAVARGRRLPPGSPRLYTIPFAVDSPDLAALQVEVENGLVGAVPDELQPALEHLAADARDCLPPSATGRLPRALAWAVHDKQLELGPWLDDPRGDATAAAALACASARLPDGHRIALAVHHPDAMGVAHLTVVPAPSEAPTARPQATTMLGYELRVTADVPGAPATTLRLAPGTIPDLRLRVTPSVADAGQRVSAELLRGPNFTGKLPAKLVLTCPTSHVELDVSDHAASAILPAGTQGWCAIAPTGVASGPARGLVYVRPAAELAVQVTPGQARYAPGQMAELHVHTQLGAAGGPAAVGLFGVDASLGQLVALPGAGDLARVRPTVTTAQPAFGTLDGQALALGRVRGANAAAAVVQRVTAIPGPPELDAVIDATSTTTFDPVAELTDHFYVVLDELHAQTRAWEAHAPQGERMTPATLASLWTAAVAACAARGQPVTDAYGRVLRLSHLPPDLLALTDPRAVVTTGLRLPEDVDNWAEWVRTEKP